MRSPAVIGLAKRPSPESAKTSKRGQRKRYQLPSRTGEFVDGAARKHGRSARGSAVGRSMVERRLPSSANRFSMNTVGSWFTWGRAIHPSRHSRFRRCFASSDTLAITTGESARLFHFPAILPMPSSSNSPSTQATHIVTYDADLLSLPGSPSDAGKRFRQRLRSARVVRPEELIRQIPQIFHER
jgi:hypothetical protein